jgi:hypothetical protein
MNEGRTKRGRTEIIKKISRIKMEGKFGERERGTDILSHFSIFLLIAEGEKNLF